MIDHGSPSSTIATCTPYGGPFFLESFEHRKRKKNKFKILHLINKTNTIGLQIHIEDTNKSQQVHKTNHDKLQTFYKRNQKALTKEIQKIQKNQKALI